MQKIISLLLALLIASPAFADITVNGQLKNAQLEKFSSDPAGKEARIYYNTTTKGAKIYNGSGWTDVGSGTGGGVKNYIANPSGASGANDWSQTGTAAIARVTTGLPRATTTGTGLKLSGGAADTDYLQTCFTLDTVDTSKKLALQWAQAPASYTDGDLRVYVSSYTSADCGGTKTDLVINQASSGNSYYSVPNATGTIDLSFDTTTASYYGVRFLRHHDAGSSALVISDVTVTPDKGTGLGPVVGPTQTYTPTFSAGFGTPTNVVVTYRQVGDKMEIEGSFSAGTVTSSTVSFSLPSGTTVDSTKLGVGSRGSVGKYWASTTGGATFVESTGNSGALFFDGTDTSNLYLANKTDSGGVQFAKTSGTGILGDGGLVSFFATVPIAEWAGSGTVNIASSEAGKFASNSSTADADDTTSFVYGPAGSSMPGALTSARSKRVRFLTPIQVTDIIVVEVYNGTTWLPVGGNSQGSFAFVLQNTTTYGIHWSPVNATDIDVVFRQYARPTGSTYGAAGESWSSYSTWKWRVRKISAAQAVGFAAATSTASGLVSAEDSGTFSLTTTGAVATTVTAKYARVGKIVTIYFPNITGTGSAATLTASGGIPAALRPVTGQSDFVVPIDNNGVLSSSPGLLTIDTSGNFSVYASTDGNAFAGNSTQGLVQTSVTYLLN